MNINNSNYNSWLKCFYPNSKANLRLFVFPYAGGASWSLRNWINELPSAIEVFLIELPGRGSLIKERPLIEFSLLIQGIANAIDPLLNKPFAFFGHSMGGLLSFELARLLRKNSGVIPIHLFISACPAPQFNAIKLLPHNLPKDAFIEKIKQLNGIPCKVIQNHEFMDFILPILRADFKALRTYSYIKESPLDCPISVFGGLEDLEISHEQLEMWKNETTSKFTLSMFEGDHFFIYSARKILLESISLKLLS